MKKIYLLLALSGCLTLLYSCDATAQNKNLKLVFIRHAERPEDGDNLNCQGLNRSMLLPAVLYKKFGKPQAIYVPSLNLGAATKHSRMLQTITPFAAKYNLNINTTYDAADYKKIGKALLKEQGTIFIVWEHNNIPSIVEYLGVSEKLKWPGEDFDSIWIVTFPKESAVLTRDRENLKPAAGCPF
jgi:hypothetical protein